MSLTKEDLKQIKTVVTEVVEPRFARIDGQFKVIREDIDDLAVAMTKDINALQADVTELKTDMKVVKSDISEMKPDLSNTKDDVDVNKDMVKDHSFRITRLEHHVFPAKS